MPRDWCWDWRLSQGYKEVGVAWNTSPSIQSPCLLVLLWWMLMDTWSLGDSLSPEPIFMFVHLEDTLSTKEDMIGSALHHAKWNASSEQSHALRSLPGWSCSYWVLTPFSGPAGYGPRCELIFSNYTNNSWKKPLMGAKNKVDSWSSVEASWLLHD